MRAYSELEISKFTDEEFDRYARLDEYGFVIGFKDDAPEEFKAAWLADEKKRTEALKEGVIL